MRGDEETRELVRQRYGTIAQTSSCCCGGGEAGKGPSPAELGYTEDQAKAIPGGADLGLGCGNPLAFAGVNPGETVLDLGSGAGIDAFLAAREVGPAGRVIGVDMTPAMIQRARANAEQVGHANVEFRLGEIEHLPVETASVDVIISNCVINLSPDKPRVFREAHRVLKPGGRLLVSDLVWLESPPAEIRDSVEALVGCLAGASLKEDYLALIREAGFRDVEVMAEHPYMKEAACCAEVAARSVVSAKVRAVK